MLARCVAVAKLAIIAFAKGVEPACRAHHEGVVPSRSYYTHTYALQRNDRVRHVLVRLVAVAKEAIFAAAEGVDLAGIAHTEIPRMCVTHGSVRNFANAPLYAPLRTPPFLD